MAIRSYNEVYLNEAKRHLGVATDYLANVCRGGTAMKKRLFALLLCLVMCLSLLPTSAFADAEIPVS